MIQIFLLFSFSFLLYALFSKLIKLRQHSLIEKIIFRQRPSGSFVMLHQRLSIGWIHVNHHVLQPPIPLSHDNSYYLSPKFQVAILLYTDLLKCNKRFQSATSNNRVSPNRTIEEMSYTHTSCSKSPNLRRT